MTLRNIDGLGYRPDEIDEGDYIGQDWRDNYFGLDEDEREILEFRGE